MVLSHGLAARVAAAGLLARLPAGITCASQGVVAAAASTGATDSTGAPNSAGAANSTSATNSTGAAASAGATHSTYSAGATDTAAVAHTVTPRAARGRLCAVASAWVVAQLVAALAGVHAALLQLRLRLLPL